MLYDNLEEWDGVGSQGEVLEGGDIFVFVAYSCCCMAEHNIEKLVLMDGKTNTIL